MTISLTRDIPITPTTKWVLEFDYTAGTPGVHTLRNGDPGYPDEPAEVEITDLVLYLLEGKTWTKDPSVYIDFDLLNLEALEALAWKTVDQMLEAREADFAESQREY